MTYARAAALHCWHCKEWSHSHAWQDDFEFQGLRVGDVREGSGLIAGADRADDAATATLAQVDFQADFCQKGTLNLMVLRETSTLRKADNGWLYAQGDVSCSLLRI